MYIFICVYVYMCTYLYIYVHIHTYIYIYMCTYTYVYIYIHIFTYMSKASRTCRTPNNTKQHNASHCITLQHTATHCNTLRHTAIHCSTLQHTTIHCNTLQHTAPHCNKQGKDLSHTPHTQPDTHQAMRMMDSAYGDKTFSAQLVSIVKLEHLRIIYTMFQVPCAAVCYSVLHCGEV